MQLKFGSPILLILFLSYTSAFSILRTRDATDGKADEIRVGGAELNFLCDNNGIFFLEQLRSDGLDACRRQQRLDCKKDVKCSRREKLRNSIVKKFSKPLLFTGAEPPRLDKERPLLMDPLKLRTKLEPAHKFFVVVDWNPKTQLCSVLSASFEEKKTDKLKKCDPLKLDDPRLKDDVFRIKLGLEKP